MYSDIVPPVGPFQFAAVVSDENSRSQIQDVVAISRAGSSPRELRFGLADRG